MHLFKLPTGKRKIMGDRLQMGITVTINSTNFKEDETGRVYNVTKCIQMSIEV